MPLSNDTSRSPIPIDAETYRKMHDALPHRMDASSNDLGGRRSNSREVSQERSVSMSVSKTELKKPDGTFTQV